MSWAWRIPDPYPALCFMATKLACTLAPGRSSRLSLIALVRARGARCSQRNRSRASVGPGGEEYSCLKNAEHKRQTINRTRPQLIAHWARCQCETPAVAPLASPVAPAAAPAAGQLVAADTSRTTAHGTAHGRAARQPAPCMTVVRCLMIQYMHRGHVAAGATAGAAAGAAASAVARGVRLSLKRPRLQRRLQRQPCNT